MTKVGQIKTILKLDKVTKVYGNGTVANRDINIEFAKGEIHSIVGENGAGKSTLMKIIFGIEAPSSGVVTYKGEEVHFKSSMDAIEAGIGMVHQHFKLVGNFTVLQNIILGNEPISEINPAKPNYFEKIIKDLVTYHSQTYHIIGDGLDLERKAFLITFANAGQWGYEAYIAPHASIQDGHMDICMMSSSAILGAASLAARLFTKTIDKSLFMDTIRAKAITLIREAEAPFHLDGDPVEMEKDVHIRIVEDGIRVLAEKRF